MGHSENLSFIVLRQRYLIDTLSSEWIELNHCIDQINKLNYPSNNRISSSESKANGGSRSSVSKVLQNQYVACHQLNEGLHQWMLLFENVCKLNYKQSKFETLSGLKMEVKQSLVSCHKDIDDMVTELKRMLKGCIESPIESPGTPYTHYGFSDFILPMNAEELVIKNAGIFKTLHEKLIILSDHTISFIPSNSLDEIKSLIHETISISSLVHLNPELEEESSGDGISNDDYIESWKKIFSQTVTISLKSIQSMKHHYDKLNAKVKGGETKTNKSSKEVESDVHSLNESDENIQYLMKSCQFHLLNKTVKNFIFLLHCGFESSNIHTSTLTHSFEIASQLLPLLKCVQDTMSCLIAVNLQVHKSNSKLLYIIMRIFRNLFEKGYCRPADEMEGEGGDGNFEDDVDGTGMGEGEGKKDVSDQLEDEQQLLGLQDDENNDDDNNEPDDDDADKDKGMEMEADFDGEMKSLNEEERNEMEDDEDEKDELDREMGDIDDDEENVLDEKMWGDDSDDENEEPPTDEKEEKFEKDAAVNGGEALDEMRTKEDDDGKKNDSNKNEDESNNNDDDHDDEKNNNEEGNDDDEAENDDNEDNINREEDLEYEDRNFGAEIKNEDEKEETELELPDELNLDGGDDDVDDDAANDADDVNEEDFNEDVMNEMPPEEEENDDGGKAEDDGEIVDEEDESLDNDEDNNGVTNGDQDMMNPDDGGNENEGNEDEDIDEVEDEIDPLKPSEDPSLSNEMDNPMTENISKDQVKNENKANHLDEDDDGEEMEKDATQANKDTDNLEDETDQKSGGTAGDTGEWKKLDPSMNDSIPPPSSSSTPREKPMPSDEDEKSKQQEPNPYRNSREALKHFRNQLHLLDEEKDNGEDEDVEENAGKENPDQDKSLNNVNDAALTDDIGATETLAPSNTDDLNEVCNIFIHTHAYIYIHTYT